MVHKLKIKNESTPERCEICHQSDFLDPISNECLRCRDIKIPFPPDQFEEESYNFFFSFSRTATTKAIACLLAISFVINTIGLPTTIFLFGVICSIVGFQRATNQFPNKSILSTLLDITLIGGGLTCSFFSGLRLLHLAGLIR
jgi:hypothetical protein